MRGRSAERVEDSGLQLWRAPRLSLRPAQGLSQSVQLRLRFQPSVSDGHCPVPMRLHLSVLVSGFVASLHVCWKLCRNWTIFRPTLGPRRLAAGGERSPRPAARVPACQTCSRTAGGQDQPGGRGPFPERGFQGSDSNGPESWRSGG